MSKTQNNVGDPPESKENKYYRRRRACIIAMAAPLRYAGNSYSLRSISKNRRFKIWLHENNKKALHLTLALHQDYATGDLFDPTVPETISHLQSAAFYLSHFQMWDDPWKNFQRPDRACLCNFGNLDSMTLVSGYEGDEWPDRALRNVADFLKLDAVNHYYDVILIDLPPLIRYYHEVNAILKQTTFLLLSYPLYHPDAMDSIFWVNDLYYELLCAGVPIKWAGIIPLGKGVDLNLCRQQLTTLTEILDESKILPVIPDANQTKSSVNKAIQEISGIGTELLVDKLLQLVNGPRPRGLYESAREYARQSGVFWTPSGTNWKNFARAPLIPREQQATLEQIAMELIGRYDAKFSANLFEKLYFAGFQTRELCITKIRNARSEDKRLQPKSTYENLQYQHDVAFDDDNGIIVDPGFFLRSIES